MKLFIIYEGNSWDLQTILLYVPEEWDQKQMKKFKKEWSKKEKELDYNYIEFSQFLIEKGAEEVTDIPSFDVTQDTF